jgi:hypothetical protein
VREINDDTKITNVDPEHVGEDDEDDEEDFDALAGADFFTLKLHLVCGGCCIPSAAIQTRFIAHLPTT